MKKDYRHRHIQLSNEFYANLAQNQVCFFCLPPICTQFWRKVTSTPASSTLRHIHKQLIIAEQWLLLKFCMTLIFSILPQKVILSRSKRGSQTSFQKQIKLIFVISRSECIIKVTPIFEIRKSKSMTRPTPHWWVKGGARPPVGRGICSSKAIFFIVLSDRALPNLKTP